MMSVLFDYDFETISYAAPWRRSIIDGVDRCVEHSRATRPATQPLTISVQQSLLNTRQFWGLTQVLHAAGLSYWIESCPRPCIYYGMDVIQGMNARVWIKAAPQSCRRTPASLVMLDGIPIPFIGAAPDRLIVGNRLGFDLGFAAAYWLALESEIEITDRDAHGRVSSGRSLLGRFGLQMNPPIRKYADLLSDLLFRLGIDPPRMARWPDARRFAVALTHDVDTPERRCPARSLLSRVCFDASTRRASYWALRAELRLRGPMEALLRPATRRREWDFAAYCRAEQGIGVRSAFYFSVVPRSAGHECDIDYDAASPRYRRLFRKLHRRGFEVGLHASYLTRLATPTLSWQADRLRAIAGCKVTGLRHHYLNLDRQNPFLTLNEAARAGLYYDTSIGFNDCAGLRAGTALPYFLPRDRSADTRPLVILPMSLADMHLPTEDLTCAEDTTLRHLDEIRDLGGLAVLNWHVGHWNSDPAWRESYRAACRYLSQADDVWIATPWQVAQWWTQRAEILSGRATGRRE